MQDVSATVTFLRSDTISILHAQTSKLFRDTVWSVRGVQSMRAKIRAHAEGLSSYYVPRRYNIPYSLRDPLALAGYFGAQRAVRALIAAGEKVDTRDDFYGQTTLHLAVEQRNGGVVDLLLAAGADMNIQNKKGRTALHLAADQSDGFFINVLLAAGADGNIQDEEGHTPLHLAARQLANNWLHVN